MKKIEHENIVYKTNSLMHCFANRFSYRKPHVHRSLELMYMCKGECQVVLKGSTLSLKEGDFAIINSSTPHELISSSTDGCTALFVQFSRTKLEVLNLNKTVFDDITITKENSLIREIEPLLFSLTEYYLSEKEFDYLLCFSESNKLMNLLLTNISSHSIDGQSEKIKSSDDRIKKTCKYIDEHYDRKISLDELSKNVYVSPQYLSSLFREAMGVTIREYIQKTRFNHALHLIDYTDAPLIDICFDAGFSDYKYMEKCFMEILGCTPREYREYSKTQIKPSLDEGKNTEEYILNREETLSLIEEMREKG